MSELGGHWVHLETSKATGGIKELKPGVVSKTMKILSDLQKGEGCGRWATVLKQGSSAGSSGRDLREQREFERKAGKTAFDREHSALTNLHQEGKEMFLHKFKLNQGFLSSLYKSHTKTISTDHGEHLWFASRVQFKLNNLLIEQAAGAPCCSQ